MAFIIIISIYAALVLVLAFGFARLETSDQKVAKLNFISIVMAVRNEPTITDFSKLDYPADKFEVIIVDDSDIPMPSATLRSPSPGKKAAITAGVAVAKGDIIVTTDADCIVTPQWLQEINKGFQDNNINMLVGGVRLEEGSTLFSKLQALEFVSVQATGAATLGLGIPTMANGANLAYRKNAFTGYEGSEHISSGDDEFLLNSFNRNSIKYLYSSDSLVTSSPRHLVTSSSRHLVTSFLQQRLRWAGKWKHNNSLVTKVFAVVVWLFHLAFIAMGLGAIVGAISVKLFIILAGAKVFAESLLLIPAANFYRVRWRWFSFLILQFVHSFYVVYIGFMSQILSPEWKGRAVETKV